MSREQRELRYLVRRLVRRERRLLLTRVVLRLLAVLAAVAVLGLLLVGQDRHLALAVVLATLGAGAWVAVLPVLRRWRPVTDPVHQARRVATHLEPAAGAEFLAAVERLDGARPGESPVLTALLLRHGLRWVDGLRPEAVHSNRGVLRALGGASALWLALLGTSLVVPGGLRGAAGWWLSGTPAQAAVAITEGDSRPDARVGDITVHYTFPEYTGLEPLTVDNTTGDVHGVPGTRVEVTLRTADEVEAAALVAYDELPLEATVAEQREVTGRFVLREDPGTWFLVLYREGVPQSTREFAIQVEEDLPPQVVITADHDVYPVAVDETLRFPWTAQDDFGIHTVDLEVDGNVRGASLAAPAGQQRVVSGDLRFRPHDLGLVPGDEATIAVAAWDSNTVSGARSGRSRSVRIVVLGAKGLQERNAQRYHQIRDTLLDLLADHLEEEWPPGATSVSLTTWGEDLGGRYEVIDVLEDEFRRSWRIDALEARIVSDVSRRARELIRYTQTRSVPGDSTQPLTAVDLEVPGGMREGLVLALEDGILTLDRILQNEALSRVLEASQDLADAAERLRESLHEDADVRELLARIDQVERLMQELAEHAAQLDKGGLREFVNYRLSESDSLLEEIRRAVAAGDLDEARELSERLARQLEQLQQGVEDQHQSRQQSGDELSDAIGELMDELTALESEQSSLQEDVHDLRQKSSQDELARAEALWEQLEALTTTEAAEGLEYAEAIEQADRLFNERERARGVATDSERLHEAVRARDLRRARDKSRDLQRALRLSRDALEWTEDQLGQPLTSPGRTELRALEQRTDEIVQLLQRLEAEANQPADPRLEQETEKLARQQDELEQRLEQASQQAEQVSRSMPIRPSGVQEGLQEAGERMSQAGSDLRSGRPMPAEGSQGAAAQRIRDARQQLQQSLQDLQRASQALDPQGQQGEESSEDSGDQLVQSPDTPVEIPSPEEFMTPEAYRRALLEGMEGEVPPEYQALKRRYYEELVHQ